MPIWRIGGVLLLFALPVWAQDRGLTATGEDDALVPEGGVRGTLRATYRRMPDDGRLGRFPHVQLDIGLADWVELGLEGDGRWITDEGERDSSNLQIGDPIWRVKLVPYREDGWSLGGVFIFEIPSASFSQGVATDQGDGQIRLFAQRTWESWAAGLTLGVAAQGIPTRRATTDASIVWSLWAQHEFAEDWLVAAEIHGSSGGRDNDNVSEGWYGRDQANARLGVSHAMGNWNVGLALQAGITNDAPDWEIMLELSHLWADAFDWSGRTVDDEGETDEPAPRPFLDPFPTRSARTVPVGRYAITLEAEARKQDDGSRLYSFPRVGTAFALGHRADLRWWADYRSLRSSDEFGGSDAGLGDMFVEVKWLPFDWTNVDAGFLFGGKLPLSDRSHGVSTGEIDTYLRALFTWQPSDFALHANVGLGVIDNPRRRHRQNDVLLWGLTAEYRFHERWLASLGIDGGDASHDADHIAEGWSGDNHMSVRGALQTWWPGSDSVALTLSGAGDLSGDSPDWEAALGVTFWID